MPIEQGDVTGLVSSLSSLGQFKGRIFDTYNQLDASALPTLGSNTIFAIIRGEGAGSGLYYYDSEAEAWLGYTEIGGANVVRIVHNGDKGEGRNHPVTNLLPPL